MKTARKTMAYSYLRMSSAEQIKGDSLRRQLDASQAYADRNGLTIDTNLVLHDLGVSAFRGANAAYGALSQFLNLVKTGQIRKNSILIVESLDRLSRTQVGEALQQFIGLLNAGVNIVTLSPERLHTKESINDIVGLLEPLIVMARAHEESKIKSERIKASWTARRNSADKKPITSVVPSWLTLNKDGITYTVDPEKVKAIKLIFKLTTDGYSLDSIAEQLNKLKVPTMSYRKWKAKFWVSSRISAIRRSRQVIGEFQPCHIVDGIRTPIGEPIKNYFPAILTEAEFYRAQDAIRDKKGRKGRRGKFVTNLFTGLMVDAKTHSSMVLQDKSAYENGKVKHLRRFLVPYDCVQRQAPYKAIAYALFEKAFLQMTKELKAYQLLDKPKPDNIDDEVATITGKMLDLEQRIAKLQEHILTVDDMSPIIAVIEKANAKHQQLANKLEQLKAKQHQETESIVLADTHSIIDALANTTGEQLVDLRTRLKALIAKLVDKMICFIYGAGRTRSAIVGINFRGGGYRIIEIGEVPANERKAFALGNRKTRALTMHR